MQTEVKSVSRSQQRSIMALATPALILAAVGCACLTIQIPGIPKLFFIGPLSKTIDTLAAVGSVNYLIVMLTLALSLTIGALLSVIASVMVIIDTSRHHHFVEMGLFASLIGVDVLQGATTFGYVSEFPVIAIPWLMSAPLAALLYVARSENPHRRRVALGYVLGIVGALDILFWLLSPALLLLVAIFG